MKFFFRAYHLKKKIHVLRVTMILDPSVRNPRLFGIIAVLSLYFNESTRMSCEAVSVLELRVENCIVIVANVHF